MKILLNKLKNWLIKKLDVTDPIAIEQAKRAENWRNQ